MDLQLTINPSRELNPAKTGKQWRDWEIGLRSSLTPTTRALVAATQVPDITL